MPPSRVVLLRHGETEWSRSGRHTGWTDVPLTDEGRRQAERAHGALRGWSFALIVTSPLARARDTAELAGLGGAEIDPDLREWNYGECEGRTTSEIQAERPGWRLWWDGCPGGESVDEVGARADRVIARVRAVDGDVCLVAHGHILRILTARWLDLPAAGGRYFQYDTAALSVLGHEHEWACVHRWNDRHHL